MTQAYHEQTARTCVWRSIVVSVPAGLIWAVASQSVDDTVIVTKLKMPLVVFTGEKNVPKVVEHEVAPCHGTSLLKHAYAIYYSRL